MKLSEHVEKIRLLIETAFRGKLGRMGIKNNIILPFNSTSDSIKYEREKLEKIFNILKSETGSHINAYDKLVEELTFTLFNRLAAIKVLEAHTLIPEIIARKSQHGGRSFSHLLWLEEHSEMRETELEGISMFLEDKMRDLSSEIDIFNLNYPYNFFPTAIEINNIFKSFNDLDNDIDLKQEIWKSDDVLGWLYESYNNYKKAAHKASDEKTEYNKVSIQSQVYTPRWVVKFLVDNSLGKLYLEMYPDSVIKNKYKIANAPKTQTRERKPLIELKLIDPVTGSGNFLLYGFDLFYDLYMDQIEKYGNPDNYDIDKIPELIITHNLHGIDLDDRAIQLAQLGLYIKAKLKKRSVKIDHFNIVSSDFFLPEHNDVKHIFENSEPLNSELEKIVTDLWTDLQQAFKFGSMIRLEEKFSIQIEKLVAQFEGAQQSFLSEQKLASYEQFRDNFFINLKKAVEHNTAEQGITFLNTKTQDAITFLQLLTQKYDVAVANPPYTDSSDFGPELRNFIEANYKKPYKFNSNLYATFIKRCYELINEKGKMALIHPLTFMYIKSFEDVRKFIIDKLHINVFVDYGLSNLFGTVMVDPAFYVLEKENKSENVWFISLDQYTRTPQEKFKKDYCLEALNDFIGNHTNKHNYTIAQFKLKTIEGWPFIYWISDGFREKFKGKSLDFYVEVAPGLQTGSNLYILRFWWEINKEDISINFQKDHKKWILYVKGGPFNKWYGNVWLVINWKNNGEDLRNRKQKDLIEGTITANNAKIWKEEFYFKEGITYSASGTKGPSFRYLPSNHIFDIGGASIFLINEKYNNFYYLLSFLNSSFSFYLVNCLNPTVNIQSGDLKKIPYIVPSNDLEKIVSNLSFQIINIKKHLCSFVIIEPNFTQNPLTAFVESTLRDRLLAFLNYENTQLTKVLINEAIINKIIFEVYDLSIEDRFQVETKMGKSVGELPVLTEARDMYLNSTEDEYETVKLFVRNLEVTSFEEVKVREIIEEFRSLYQSNNNLEEFCIRHQVNPINICYWYNESKIMPRGRAQDIALEFLADAFRTMLMEDEDGIIPLVGLPGEPRLLDRLEQYCINKGVFFA